MYEPFFSFGIVTDCQYADIPDNTEFGDRRFRLSLPKLEEAIGFFNTKDLEFVVHLGDVIDQDIKSFDTIMPVFDKSKAPVWQLAGNHDFWNKGHTGHEDRDAVLQKLGILDYPYYARSVKDWRFIVLDGNEVGVIESQPGSKEYQEGQALLDKLARAGAVNAKPWNGGLSQGQLEWVHNELRSAEQNGERAIIFSHYPIYPKNRENLLGDEDVLRELAGYKHLRAFINGHYHVGNYGQYEHLHCLTMHGMVDTAENAYALAHVYDDRIEIEGHGREPSRTLKF